MRKIVVALAGTVSGLVMLFGYHTSLDATGPLAVSAVPAGTGASTTTTSGAVTAGSSSTVTGDTVQTRWGPVQVQISVAAGALTDVTAVRYPTGNSRDQQVNGYALPVLAREALAAQSAQIDHVSGATVTSDGYAKSLQSALDQANL